MGADWQVTWAGVAAVGQVLGAGATFWAVMVALRNARRDRRLKHQDVYPQLVISCERITKVLERNSWGTPTKSNDKNMAVRCRNEGGGPAFNLKVEVVPSGQVVLESHCSPIVECPYVQKGTDHTFEFCWTTTEETQFLGVIRLEYSGQYGARYSREYGFVLRADEPKASVEYHEKRDKVTYPD